MSGRRRAPAGTRRLGQRPRVADPHRRRPGQAVGRGREDEVVAACTAGRNRQSCQTAYDRPGRVDRDRRERDRAQRSARVRVQVGDERAREGGAAVGRDDGRDRAGEALRRRCSRRRRRRDRRRAGSRAACRRASMVAFTGADQVAPPSSLHWTTVAVLRVVGVRRVAAAAVRARGAVVAREPVLVEQRARRDRDRRRPVQAVRRARRRARATSRALERERADEPDAVRGVVGDASGRRRSPAFRAAATRP